MRERFQEDLEFNLVRCGGQQHEAGSVGRKKIYYLKGQINAFLIFFFNEVLIPNRPRRADEGGIIQSLGYHNPGITGEIDVIPM